MKTIKLFFAFLLFAGVASCSSDDDGNTNEPADQDRIVGEWRIQSLSIDGEQTELSECDLQSRIVFSANGNITVTSFYEDVDSEQCVSEVYTETWEYRGNNVYRITDEDGPTDVTITFSNNNNTFTITEENEEGSYTATYVRV